MNRYYTEDEIIHALKEKIKGENIRINNILCEIADAEMTISKMNYFKKFMHSQKIADCQQAHHELRSLLIPIFQCRISDLQDMINCITRWKEEFKVNSSEIFPLPYWIYEIVREELGSSNE